MATVYAFPNESIDSLWKRFKKKVDNNSILSDLRKKEYYVKPSVAKKLKSAQAQKRARKKDRITQKFMQSNVNFKFNHDKTVKILVNPNQNRFNRKPR